MWLIPPHFISIYWHAEKIIQVIAQLASSQRFVSRSKPFKQTAVCDTELIILIPGILGQFLIDQNL